MAIADGTVLRIVASLLFPDSVIAQNIFYTVFTDNGSSNDTDDVLDDLVDYVEDIYTDLLNEVAEEVDLGEMKVYEYDSVDDDWDEVGTRTPSVAFNQTADGLPNGAAALIHARSTDPDVSGHKYFGGFGNGKAVDNDWTSGCLTQLVQCGSTWVTNFVGTATGGDFFPGVWSPTRTNFYAFNGTFIVNGVVAYQRRRKPGVGI